MQNFRHIFYVTTKIYVDFVDICRSVDFQICVSVSLSFKDIFSTKFAVSCKEIIMEKTLVIKSRILESLTIKCKLLFNFL